MLFTENKISNEELNSINNFFEAFETDMYYALIENVELAAGMDGEYVWSNNWRINRRIATSW